MSLLPEDDEKKGEGWIVSYADLMTLLFAFFVVLYGIKPEGETVAVLGVTSSIRESFVEIPDEIPTEQRKGPILKGKVVFKSFRGNVTREPILKKYRRSENVTNVINKDLNQLKELLQIISPAPSPTSGSGNQQAAVSARLAPEGIELRMIANYYYEAGSYRVRRSELDKLRKIGELLLSMRRKIVISGHTDNQPREGPIGNWELSALRASYIARFFMSELNFPEEWVTVAGYADTRPIADNETPEGRKLNRRIEIKVRYDE